MDELFIDDCNILEDSFHLMNDAVVAFLEGRFDDAETFTKKVISYEKKQDRLSEKIIERLFGRETMVFSRSDRLHIVESLDRIVDKVEIVVRKLVQYRHTIQGDMAKGINDIAHKNAQIGTKVKELIIAVLEDFEKAKDIVITITDLRRDVRDQHWQLLKLNYTSDPGYLVFSHIETLVKDLCKCADRAEEFADEIFGLISKYAL